MPNINIKKGITLEKYKLLEEDYIIEGSTKLYRIQALKSFSDVKSGDLGGHVQSIDNLSMVGDSWVYYNARVYDDACIYEDAKVYGHAEVYDYAEIFGNAKVYGHAEVCDEARVYDNACIYNHARIYGNAWIYGDARVYGNAEIYGNVVVYENVIMVSGNNLGNKTESKDKDDKKIKYAITVNNQERYIDI